MASLSLFYDQSAGISQSPNKAYGVDSSNANKFRVDSIFNVSGAAQAYAMVSGTVLLQQQAGVPEKVNLILKPHEQSNLKLPIKYLIYRGLQTSDFIEDNNPTNPNNTVKTSGSELIVAMQSIQQERAPNDDIPVQALFGNDLAPANDKNIDEFFFKNLAATSQLFTVDCGIELGKFAMGEVSIEIILENPEYNLTVEDAKKTSHEIDVTGLSGAEKKWKQDLVRHFVDPAAYYGLHHDIAGGIEYRTSSGKLYAETPAQVYSQIVNKFLTKNKVYLDVRNENGYSYNYYGNYVGTGADANKNMKIGQTATTLVAKEYYTNGWAIHIVDVTAGNGTENEIFAALRINDNARPLLAGWNLEISPFTIVDPPVGTSTTSGTIYYVDDSVLIPAVINDFTNPFSFKVPNTGGSSPAQLSTIARLDYNKQRTNSNLFALADTDATDYYLGTTHLNILWDIDSSLKWNTDNFKRFVEATEGIGFSGYVATGHIINNSSDTPTNENIILYSAPENYFIANGLEKNISFNKEGGAVGTGSFVNLFPDASLERTNLQLSASNSILSFSFNFSGKLSKAIQLLGLTKTEWDTSVSNAASSLSDYHIKSIKLNSLGAQKTDENGTAYNDYEVAVAGMNTGTLQEIETGLTVYTTDHHIFSTQAFAENYEIDYTGAEAALEKFLNILNPTYPITALPDFFEDIPTNRRSNEEISNLQSNWIHGVKNKNLFFLDNTMKDKVSEFKLAIDSVEVDYTTVKTLISQKGEELLNHAKQRIKQQDQLYTNKDGILYLARLMMQVVIKNHPKLLSKFPSKISTLSELFEKHSRGLEGSEKPDFAEETTDFNVLISGYDPFSGGVDWQGHMSNSSGNIALSLDGIVLNSDSNSCIIHSVIFPVRYYEFNERWIEDFFKSYVESNNVELIITFSYGIDTYDLQIDRFASSYRNGDIPDNNDDDDWNQNLQVAELNNAQFILNQLPYLTLNQDGKLAIDLPNNDCKIGVNYRAYWKVFATDMSGSTPVPNVDVTAQHYLSKKSLGPYMRNEHIIPIEKIRDFNVREDYGNAQPSDEIKYSDENDQEFIDMPSWDNYPDPASWINNYNDFNIKARMGSGQWYFSNEIHYRVSNLRDTINPDMKTGHIHVGFLKGDPVTDRKQMLSALEYIINKFINT